MTPADGPPGDATVSDLLELVVNLAVATVRDVHAASVSLLGGDGSAGTVVSTSAAAQTVEEIQHRTMAGPSVFAVQNGEDISVTVPEPRWPEFSDCALSQGVRAVWSLPLRAASQTLGALTLYSMTGMTWQGPSPAAAGLLADQAAMAIGSAAALATAHQLNANLREALVTRTVIGQAQGILMARQGISSEEAFSVLRRTSQRSNRKLRDIAANMVGEASRR